MKNILFIFIFILVGLNSSCSSIPVKMECLDIIENDYCTNYLENTFHKLNHWKLKNN